MSDIPGLLHIESCEFLKRGVACLAFGANLELLCLSKSNDCDCLGRLVGVNPHHCDHALHTIVNIFSPTWTKRS